MSRTLKDKKEKSFKIGKKMKFAAKQKRKTLKNESNPRVLKLKSADNWNYD